MPRFTQEEKIDLMWFVFKVQVIVALVAGTLRILATAITWIGGAK